MKSWRGLRDNKRRSRLLASELPGPCVVASHAAAKAKAKATAVLFSTVL